MRHKGWKLAFGLSWIPAVMIYWLGAGTMFAGSQPTGLFAPAGVAYSFTLIPIFLMAAGQAVLGYFAFRR